MEEEEAGDRKESFVDRLLTCYLPIAFVCFVVLALIATYLYGWERILGGIFAAVEAKPEEKVTQAAIINLLLLVWVVFCLPAPLFFSILDGFFFGFFLGFALVFCTQLTAALLSLALGRSCLKARIRAWVRRHKTANEMVAILEEDKTAVMLILFRLTFIPVCVKNYTLASLDVTVCRFFLVCIPAEILYCGLFAYFGSKAHSVADELRKGDVNSVWALFSGWEIFFVGSSVLIAVAIAVLAWREFRRRKELANERTALIHDGRAP